jgi:hypothetical protein
MSGAVGKYTYEPGRGTELRTDGLLHAHQSNCDDDSIGACSYPRRRELFQTLWREYSKAYGFCFLHKLILLWDRMDDRASDLIDGWTVKYHSIKLFKLRMGDQLYEQKE